MTKGITGISLVMVAALCSLSLAACKGTTVSAGLRGFNHTQDKYIYTFGVNGAAGPNVAPQSGGGKLSCCVLLPATWRPGLRVKVYWEYDRMKESDPQLPPQSIELELPKYGKGVGDLQVHFYENHQVKLVISNCFPGHPFYPMDEQSLLPWKPDGSKEDHLQWERKVGKTHDC